MADPIRITFEREIDRMPHPAVAPEDAEAVVPVLVPVPAQAAVVQAVARKIPMVKQVGDR